MLALLCACVCGSAAAGDWPAWRGPDGTGVSADTNLPLTWGANDGLRWRVALPDRGNSTPIVCGDRVFVTQAIEAEHRRTLMCFSRSGGRLLWQSGVTWPDAEPTNRQNPYCSASPVTDGRRVVAYFGSAGLHCYDYAGKEMWHRDVGKVDSWQGSGSSPMLYRQLCILNAGPGTNAALLACNSDTGELVWTVTPPKGRGGAAPDGRAPTAKVGDFDGAMMAADPRGTGGFLGSWSTPVVARSGGRDELLVVHPFDITAYDPQSGQELWTCGGLPEQAFASPAVGEGIVVATGHKVAGGGTRATAVKLGGDGDVTGTRRLWQTDLPHDFVGSGVITGGHVYLVNQFGSVVCLDLTSGRKVAERRLTAKQGRRGSWSSIVLAGGKLLVPNQSGNVFVLTASPRLDVLAVNTLGDQTTCASLAVSNGNVFLRTYEALWCFGTPK